MKSKKKWIAAAAVILAIIAVALFMRHNIDSTMNKAEMNLYFFNDQKTTIVAEKREIKYNTDSELTEKVLDTLIHGPSDKRNSRIMSPKTKVLALDTSTENVTVDFSREYLSGDESQDILTTYAVVKSLCEISGIQSVKITVETEEIKSPDGTIIGALSSSDINIPSENTGAAMRDIILYFGSKDGSSLVKEIRSVKLTDKQPVEQYIVNELITGPKDKNLQSVLSSDTALISVETKDHICYVNFKSNFIDKNTGSREKEFMAVYSIVNSLTELDTVREVQFLIDGKKVEKFGELTISDLFHRNQQIIES